MESFVKKSSWLKALLMFLRGKSEEKKSDRTVADSDRGYRGNDLF